MVKEHINLDNNNKHLILFSRKGKQHDTKELVDNLLSLINLINSINENRKNNETEHLNNTIRNNPSGIIGKYVSHTWSDQTWRGKVISFNDSEFEITYWDSTMPENTGEVYCLKLAEILEDVDDGTFSFNGVWYGVSGRFKVDIHVAVFTSALLMATCVVVYGVTRGHLDQIPVNVNPTSLSSRVSLIVIISAMSCIPAVECTHYNVRLVDNPIRFNLDFGRCYLLSATL
ncbi:unnamed protein product [Mytilus edulis]|uniref:Uncharacterized protein n=1 Tax=Mytilus edulis TaxID=6550 RepID=A0A8S3TXV0_MYTED|nr:unnamed protein product [Mytilus edulis]